MVHYPGLWIACDAIHRVMEMENHIFAEGAMNSQVQKTERFRKIEEIRNQAAKLGFKLVESAS